MANVFTKPEKVAAQALGLLERDVVLAALVQRDAGTEFTGAKNDTVNVKRPSRLAGFVEALDAMDGGGDYEIKSEDLNESSIPVKLDKHVYSAVDLSDRELTLDVTDFGAQVMSPQVKALATRLEFMVAGAMNDNTAIPATAVTGDATKGAVRKAIISLRKALNSADVPADGRILAVGVDVEAYLLEDPNLVRANEAGDAGALRNAELGRLHGFRVVVSNTLDADRMVAFHPSAFILVNRAPVVPSSIKDGASQSYAGFSMRVLKDYNSKTAHDRSFVSTFAGINTVKDKPVTYDKAGKPTIGTEKVIRAVAVKFTHKADEAEGGK